MTDRFLNQFWSNSHDLIIDLLWDDLKILMIVYRVIQPSVQFSKMVSTSEVTSSIMEGSVGIDLRRFLISLKMSPLLFTQASSKVFFLMISVIFLFFLIWKWYRFLVFFVIRWSSVFNGRPADCQIECQKYALSLNGFISSFHRGIGDFFPIWMARLGDGMPSSVAYLIFSITDSRRSSHSLLWESFLQWTFDIPICVGTSTLFRLSCNNLL